MKRQLDRLKGKRLVTGDPNLMTKDEICINATPNGVEVKEIGTDGSIKDIASGSTEGSSISENKKYFKAVKDILDITDTQTLKVAIASLGYYPVYIDGMYISRFYTNTVNTVFGTYIPYYIIDFNSIDCINIEIFRMTINDYPYNNLIKGLIVPEDDKEEVEQMVIKIKALFEECFVEITKEEYLEIHNQCIAGTWVPEWEK